MNSYQEKREAKIARYKQLAGKKRQESTQSYQTAKEIGSHIPMGQPILVGHHSEKRHRRDIDKIDSAMRKSVELSDTASYYDERARAVENNTAISSDDPEAIAKLTDKISKLEGYQEIMKASNAILRKKISEVEKVDALVALGMSQEAAIALMNPKNFGGPGFPSFSLTNNNASIRTAKKRLELLQKRSTMSNTEQQVGDLKIVDNVEENRLQLFFPGKPADNIRSILKSHGFRWSPFNGCWQAYRNYSARAGSKEVIKLLTQ